MHKQMIAAGAVLALGTAANADLLWDAGQGHHGMDPDRQGLITHFGTAPGGADSSVIGDPATSFGGNWTQAGDDDHHRRADSFIVGDAPGWYVDSITVYGYVTGGDVTGNPFGSFNINVWDDSPDQGNLVGSSTDYLTPEFTGIYRQSSSNFPDNDARGIFAITLTFDDALELSTGEYWWDVQHQGENTAWMPVLTDVDGDGNPITPEGHSMHFGSDGWNTPDSGDQTYSLPAQVNGSIIPAPGALALLGLAGLVGSRRRR